MVSVVQGSGCGSAGLPIMLSTGCRPGLCAHLGPDWGRPLPSSHGCLQLLSPCRLLLRNSVSCGTRAICLSPWGISQHGSLLLQRQQGTESAWQLLRFSETLWRTRNDHLCYVLLVRSKSQVTPTVMRREWHKDMNTRRSRSRRPAESAHQTYYVLETLKMLSNQSFQPHSETHYYYLTEEETGVPGGGRSCPETMS